MMVTEKVLWCWLLVATCTTTDSGNMAVQWILYQGLQLSWHEASQFCNSSGGHLPVLNTSIRYNGFTETAGKWHSAALLLNDIWTGLYTPTHNENPTSCGGGCSLQPKDLSSWRANDLDCCVRYKQENQNLCTSNCNALYNIVCEFDKGSCRNSTKSGLLPTNLEIKQLAGSTMDSCWQQCLTYLPTSGGRECVGVVFSWDKCTGDMSDTLLSIPIITLNSSATTMLKECFADDVNNCIRRNTSITNSRGTPQPAVDPCSSNRIPSSAVALMSTNDQMSTTASTQPQRSEETATQTTREQPSAEPHTEATWLTTKISAHENTDHIAAETVSTSWTTQNSKRQSTEGTATTLQYNEDTVENTRDRSTQRLTSNIELNQDQTPTTSDASEYSSSSQMTPSTNGCKPVLCSCIKSSPSVSTMLPIIHRNTTSRYRRSLNSEWGSPSVYTSTASATFVIVVGVAGFLFVVCDINKFLSLFGNKCSELHERDRVSHP